MGGAANQGRTGPPVRGALAALALAVTLAAAPAPASAATRARQPVQPLGTIIQLAKGNGCLIDRSTHTRGCHRVRALKGPAPFLGSEAITMSRDGRNVYVASSTSNAIAIFKRNRRTGQLTQPRGSAGCIANGGTSGCASAVALKGPNSVSVSSDGRNVYATAVNSDSIAVFRRNPSTGALTQLPGNAGCLIGTTAIPRCGAARALIGPDVVAVSPNGANVYVGAFFGNAIVVLNRNPSTGALAQPSDSTGCLTETATSGCATGIALGAPEGLTVSGDGTSVYAATALSNALVVLSRNTGTGALTQATGGSGCITNQPLAGCTTGVQLDGANAVTVSPDNDDVYVTSLFSNSVTSFTRSTSTGTVVQKSGTQACVIYVLAVNCSLGRAMRSPEGLTVSPDGATVYAAAFNSGAVDVLNRNSSGALMQKPRRPGCVVVGNVPGCKSGRGLRGVSSIVVSPDGRYVYTAAFKSNAVGVFRRIAKTSRHG